MLIPPFVPCRLRHQPAVEYNAAKLLLGGTSLLQFCETRWGSGYDLIRSVFTNKKVIEQVCHTPTHLPCTHVFIRSGLHSIEGEQFHLPKYHIDDVCVVRRFLEDIGMSRGLVAPLARPHERDSR